MSPSQYGGVALSHTPQEGHTMSQPYFEQYANLETHWFICRVCYGISLDSDLAPLAGKADLSPADVAHDAHCPGRTFPDKHVRRITIL